MRIACVVPALATVPAWANTLDDHDTGLHAEAPPGYVARPAPAKCGHCS